MNTRPLPMIVSTFTAALLLGAAPAQGDVLVNTFGPNDTAYMSGGMVVSGNLRIAVPLTPANDFAINRVEASLHTNGQPALATFSIVSNDGGVPGSTVVWSNTQAVGARANYVFSGPAATLNGGQTYWLVASSTSLAYNWNQTPVYSAATMARSSETTWTVSAGWQPAYRISSVPIACCNPGTGHCAVVEVASCIAMQLQDLGATTCAPDACRACRADFDQNGATNVDDLFLFLNEWFVGCP